MGSAFPCDGLGSYDTVLFLMWERDDDSLICHFAHEECPIEYPHRLSQCGRFSPPVSTGERPSPDNGKGAL
jgi:hypothetical protein